MSSVLVLGAGFVAGPVVRYLLDRGQRVRVAEMLVEKAEALVADHPNGEALAWNSADSGGLQKLIGEADLVVSLLPAGFHLGVAKQCIAAGKSMVTTSYVSEEMQALNAEAKAAGVVILNECGLDPGIDHMSAMRVIDGVRAKGGRVVSFRSYCGGIPAPEANNNPFGYKFSWSPRGVLLAGKSAARYLKEKQEINVAGPELFGHYWQLKVPGFGELEAYPNRNSLGYLDVYGLEYAQTMFRGTLRYPSWCEKLRALVDLGYLDTEERDWSGMSYADLCCERLGIEQADDLQVAAAKQLGLDAHGHVLEGLAWLDLFSEKPLPVERGGVIDILTETMLAKMQYAPAERDMVVLYHDFTAEYDEDKRERITSTLIDYGVAGGNSAMSRTVGLPAAACTRLLLEGKIKARGVMIPTSPEIYAPVLMELEALGIKCKEEANLV